MSPRVFMGLLAVTVLLVVGAVATTFQDPPEATVSFGTEHAFQALREASEDAAGIVITAAGETFTIERAGDGWVVQEKAGYSADISKVRGLIVAMADLTLAEKKTRRPDRYERLELGDPESAESASKRVRILDASGNVLAEAILGKTTQKLVGQVQNGTYLRLPDEEQAWLGSGTVTVPKSPVEWLEKSVVKIASDTVRRVEMQGTGLPFAISRTAPGDGFDLEGKGEQETPDTSKMTRLGSGLSLVELEDVKRADDIDWSGDDVRRAVYTTFDGVDVTADVVQTPDKAYWARFEAAPATDTDATADGADEGARTAAEEKVKTINGRVAGWAYRLEDYIGERLMLKREEMLAKPDSTS